MIPRMHCSVGAALAASTLLGVAVRSGRLELGQRRWLHHALYATSLGTATGAVLVGAASGQPTWPVAAGTLAVLGLLPATRGGSTAHATLAIAASTVYLAGTILVTRRR